MLSLLALASFAWPSLVMLIVVLVVCGIAWTFLGPHVAEPFKSIIVVVVVLAFCLALLRWVGLL